MSIVDWINESVPGGIDSPLGQLLDIAYNIEYGAESAEQSSLNLLYLLGYQGPGNIRIFGKSNEKYHVRGGNDQVPARLADALAGQVTLGSELVAVKLNNDATYTLSFRQGNTSRTVTPIASCSRSLLDPPPLGRSLAGRIQPVEADRDRGAGNGHELEAPRPVHEPPLGEPRTAPARRTPTAGTRARGT